MSKRRLIWAALFAALLAANPAAQTPSLEDVLKRAATYVAAFRNELSGIVAEEVYRQEIANTGRLTNPLLVNPRRQLKSALLLIKPGGSDRYVELRDVFEVDGAPLHDRQGRLESLLRDRTASADAQIQAIIAESARYNIGRITRNVNTPLMTLQFLDAEQQSRFQFKHADRRPNGRARPLLGRPGQRQHPGQRARRRWQRRHRDCDGELSVGSPDGLPGADRNARVVPGLR
jgi:hypothetical protein